MHVELLIAGHRIGGPCDQAVAKELSRSPIDGKVIGTYAEGGWSELLTAIAAAHEAQGKWQQSNSKERIDLCQRLIEVIKDRRQDLTELLEIEIAKPRKLAQKEFDRLVKTFEETYLLLQSGYFEPKPIEEKQAIPSREPRGVIFAITPFNFPLNLVAHKIAPALASRNAVILKPSPKSALTTLSLAHVLQEAGIPDGLLNTWIGPNQLILKALKDPRIKMLSFTGSSEVGWSLRDQFPRLHMTLELGGDASAVIAPNESDQFDEHFEMILSGAFSFAGQSCISTQHLWVPEEDYDRWSLALRDWVRSSDGLVQIDSAARARLKQTVEDAEKTGSQISRSQNKNGAVLIEELSDQSPLFGTEAFAPLLILHRYSQLYEAFSRIQKRTNPIHISLFCSHEEHDEDFFRLQVPGLLKNKPTNYRDDALPYGGSNKSGIGREGPKYAFEEMTEWKTIYR